ncbi:MAG TPA: ATP-binding protein [Thermomicrobiales bacterium]|nr:ATP-binding protein [Thermomicrobiales bacterium]
MARRSLLPGSIRFRLTAWYGLLLALVLTTLGVAVLTLARSRLQADMDTRITRTAADIGMEIERSLAQQALDDGSVNFDDIVPDLSSFASRGLLIQIADASNRIVRASDYAPASQMIAPAARLDDNTPILKTEQVLGWDVRAVRYPLLVADDQGAQWYIGAVLVGERLDTLDETLASLGQVLVTASLGGLALALAGGWALAGRALRPVDRVTAAAASIAAADGSPASLATRLPLPATGDELERLSATFNRMLDRLEASFLTQRRFVADASHELRTPLTAIRGNIDVLARQVAALPADPALRSDVVDAVDDIRRESARMARLLDDLLLLARSDMATDQADPAALRQPLAPVRLDETARDAIRAAAGLSRGQSLRLGPAAPVVVAADRDRLQQLALILIDNALRHTPPGRTVEVGVDAAGDEARLTVRDEGRGIAPQHLPRLFDRFYRIDDARGRTTGGAGLGLAIAKAIATAHGGAIAVASAPGRGSVFTVTLPAVEVGTSGRRDVEKMPVAPPPAGQAGLVETSRSP